MPMLRTRDELSAYLQDEYFSEVLLRKLSPAPRATPPARGVVKLAWGVATSHARTGAPQLQMYTAEATGVTSWTLAGKHDPDAVVELAIVAANGPADDAIHLVQRVPGELVLRCAALAIERGPVRAYRPPPVPNAGELLIWGPRELTWNELLVLLGAPAEIALYADRTDRAPPTSIGDDARARVIVSPYFSSVELIAGAPPIAPWLRVAWKLAITTRGHYMQLFRGTADDDAWARVLALPGMLGPCTVQSGSLRLPGDEWCARIARGDLGA